MDTNKEYNIAISFACEERTYAEILSEILIFNGLNVFYDKFETSNLIGKNLLEEFSEIYGSKADYCIILISESYCKKAYTNFERRNALDKLVFEKPDYIIPIKFDDSWVKGLPKATSYFDIKNYSIIEISEIILKKLYPEYIENNLLSIPNLKGISSLKFGKPKKNEIIRYQTIKKIRDNINKYLKFSSEKNGLKAIQFLSAATIDWYDKICYKIKFFTKEQIKKLSIIEQTIILRSRSFLSDSDLKIINGEDLLITALNNGMIGKETMSKIVFTKIDFITENTINVYYRGGKNGEIHSEKDVTFFKENNIWKIDLVMKMQQTDVMLMNQAQIMGFGKQKFINYIFSIDPNINNINELYNRNIK